MRRLVLPAAVPLLVALLSACSAGTEGEVTVLAAASLARPFETLDDVAAGAGLAVALSYAGSPTLVAQVRQGAPADVIAVADERLLEPLARDGLLAGEPVRFARQPVVVAISAGARIDRVADLARPGVRVVVAAPGVPAGDRAAELFEAAGLAGSVTPRIVSREDSVAGVLTRLISGEADAGVVYLGDARDAGLATVGEPYESPVSYAAAVVADAPHPGEARRFLDLLTGGEVARLLTEAGFTGAGAAADVADAADAGEAP